MEGPSLIIVKEEVDTFKGRKIIRADGNAKVDFEKLPGQKIIDFKTWGKHFLICFPGFFIRIHFLMFGTYRINEKKKNRIPKLSFIFEKGQLNFYSCSVKLEEGKPSDIYNWSTDIMSDKWEEKKVIQLIKGRKDEMVCDVLLDQNIFTGVGNIIKNEALYRVKIHPETRIKILSASQIKKLVQVTRQYSFDFYQWRKKGELKKHWLVYHRKNCPECNSPVIAKTTGKLKRESFFCPCCQKKS